MVESGTFRTSINGFNKTDVLDYIDAMQSQHMGEMQSVKIQSAELEKTTAEKDSRIDELEKTVHVLESKAGELVQENSLLKQKQEDTDRFMTEHQRLKQDAELFALEKHEYASRLADMQERLAHVQELEQQNKVLHEQLNRKIDECEQVVSRERKMAEAAQSLCSEKENLVEQSRQANEQLRQCQHQLKNLQESRSRYDDLAGDVGAFIMELHSMGQRFLETAYKKSDSCLTVLETSVSALSAQLTDARAQVGQARQELLDHGTTAGMRLDELVQALEESADTIGNSKKSSTEETPE